MHIPDPDSLTDIEWAMRVKELEYIRTQEALQAEKAASRHTGRTGT